jgi:hypothetical protein
VNWAGVLGLGSVLLALTGCSCSKSGPSAEEQARAAESEHQRLQAEIEAFHAPYHEAARRFLHATSSGDYAGAYALMAPSYRNMVSADAFAARIRTNRNFAREVDIKILHTTSQAGTTKVRCIFGDLGLAELTFADTRGGPRISAITIGGMPALPAAN